MRPAEVNEGANEGNREERWISEDSYEACDWP